MIPECHCPHYSLTLTGCDKLEGTGSSLQLSTRNRNSNGPPKNIFMLSKQSLIPGVGMPWPGLTVAMLVTMSDVGTNNSKSINAWQYRKTPGHPAWLCDTLQYPCISPLSCHPACEMTRPITPPTTTTSWVIMSNLFHILNSYLTKYMFNLC